MIEKIFGAGSHTVAENLTCEHLIIDPQAVLTAPAGKYLVLTVDGSTKAVVPGEYQGNVALSVAEYYVEGEYPSVNRGKPIDLETAICVVDGKIQGEKSVPAAVYGGKVTGRSADDIYLAADRENFAGVIVDGNTEYTVNNARIELDGMGLNDFVGMGAGVAVLGDAKVTINDSDIHLSSVTRCAVHAGGKSVVTVNNCRLSNRSPQAELGSWSWGISVRGTNRLCQLADDAEVHYNGCELTTNGWGVLSVDGSNYAKMFVKDSNLTLTGPRSHGYGVFCIGPTPIELDHTHLDVNGFPIMMMSMERKGSVTLKNGSLITGRRYGAHLTSDGGGTLTVQDSAICTDKSAIVAKNSNSHIIFKNAQVEAGNHVILQMMDTDDPGLAGDFIDVSMYETMEDQYIPGRDLTTADPMKDLFVYIQDSDLEGDLFNSSTNLCEKASKEKPAGIPKRPGIVPPGRLAGSIPEPGGPELPPPPLPGAADGEKPVGMPGMEPLRPKNLEVTLDGATLTGAISAAKQHYRPGITYIDETTREELCNVTQTPAPAINNGVIVILKNQAVWKAEGTSYLTALTIAPGATLKGRLLVDGKETPAVPGTYAGALTVEA
jgi:hypothetical protein